MKNFLSFCKNGTLYIGVTNDLNRKIQIHKKKLSSGFTKRYSVDRLIYFETFESIVDAIRREKQLKKWNRLWKIQLIGKVNPTGKDLSSSDLV